MAEGPTIYIAREELNPFKGQSITGASGTTKIDWDILHGQKLRDVKIWGKHLLLLLTDTTIKVHLLMFGSYTINRTKDKIPKMTLHWSGGSTVHFYSCAAKLIEEDIEPLYDWEADVLSERWNSAKAKKKLQQHGDMMVADALLNQDIFSGVGNIIKNEVCYRIQVHPASRISALPAAKLNELVKEAVNYSYDFLRWKKEGTLKAHWLAHTKKICSRDNTSLVKEHMGDTNRRTFYCPACQVLYT
jgi:endonuclease-8